MAGGPATAAFDYLDAAVETIGPRVIVPMQYYHPRGRLHIQPVDSSLSRYPDEMITRVGGPHLELTPETLPAEPHIFVLEQSR